MLALRRLKMAIKRRDPRAAAATTVEPAAAGLAGSGRAVFVLALVAAVGCGVGSAESVFSKKNTTSSAGGSGSGGAGGVGGAGSATGVGGASSASTGGPPDPIAICINEIMPDNEATLVDENGATPDWIELHNPTDAAVDLEGWALSDDELQPMLHVLPKGVTLPAKGFLLLYADGETALGPQHLSFQLAAGGGLVALFAPDGAATKITYGPINADFAAARRPDCCAGDACIELDFLGTPGSTNTPVVIEPVTVLPPGSTYRYYDLGAPPPANWADPGFDDSGWATGAAPFGYNDAHINTVVDYGPDQQDKYITTWIRTTFEVTDVPTVASATVSLLRDDGAAAYINGVEVARSNLPAGPLTADTLATVTVTNGEAMFFPFTFDKALLVEGTNVIAVEVHQSVANSSDLGVDAQVIVEKPAP
jgi:hypothetical protein